MHGTFRGRLRVALVAALILLGGLAPGVVARTKPVPGTRGLRWAVAPPLIRLGGRAPEVGARPKPVPARLREFTGRVLRVRDGDSLEVRKGADIYEVRLARIDAPELHQPRGDQAKEFTRIKVEGATVIVRARTI